MNREIGFVPDSHSILPVLFGHIKAAISYFAFPPLCFIILRNFSSNSADAADAAHTADLQKTFFLLHLFSPFSFFLSFFYSLLTPLNITKRCAKHSAQSLYQLLFHSIRDACILSKLLGIGAIRYT